FLADARAIVKERGTPDQIRVCERLWEGSFESFAQLREFFYVMGPLYSRRFRPEEFDEGWRRGRHALVALNRGFGDFLRTFDFTEQLHEIRCPTLIIGGAHDWICPPQHSRLIAERIPRAHLKIFADSAHMVAVDEPDAYLAAVRGFLTHAAP